MKKAFLFFIFAFTFKCLMIGWAEYLVKYLIVMTTG